MNKRTNAIAPSLTLEITAKAAKMRAEGFDVVGFGAGEPDMPTPQFIVDAAANAMRAGKMKYTATAGIIELRKAICKKLRDENGLEYVPEQIVVSNGAKQSLFNVIQTVVDAGDEVIIIRPFWITYTEIIKLAGGVPVFVDDITAIKAAITNKTRAVIINSPSNPSGVVYSRKELETLAGELCKTDIVVISDEIYEKLVYGVEHFSIARVYPNTIVVNGFSKSHAMTGWRVGFTASSREIADTMVAFQSHTTSSVNTPAQYGALAALVDANGAQFIHDMQKTFAARREYVLGRLSNMPDIQFTKPDGAFYVMIDVSKFGAAIVVANALLGRGVAVIPCEQFGAPNHIRMSYATGMTDLERGLDRMEQYFNGVQ